MLRGRERMGRDVQSLGRGARDVCVHAQLKHGAHEAPSSMLRADGSRAQPRPILPPSNPRNIDRAP